jgi:transposase
MTSMATTAVFVTGGVDTHGHTHHAAVLDYMGRQLGDREFPTSPAGYRALLQWMSGHGVLDRVGVEGTGTYGVGLARHLREAGVQVVEVDRPDRRARRAQGKSDPLDAYSAARAALSGRASVVPKMRDGKVEAIRAIRVARSSAVKARTQATNQLKALIVTGSTAAVTAAQTTPST